jgi:serine protease Do
MNPKKLQALGVVLGTALFVATGLLTFTAADRAKPAPAAQATATAKASHAPSVASTAGLQSLSDNFADVAEHVQPAVVSVYSEKVVKYRRPDFGFPFGDDSPFRFFFGEEGPAQPQPRRSQPREFQQRQGGMGSGIIIDKDGHILTNNHVVQDMDEIKITLADKRTFEAEVVGTDPKTDLAVIKIKGKAPADLPVAELGNSDAVRVGDWVLAIGAPFGFAQTVTAGIISAKGRTGVGDNGQYEDFLQTDAAINPGNSGGPLVNLKGEVIGINSAIATRIGQFAGVGFAIPSDLVKTIWPTLAQGGTIKRGLLGVIIQEITPDIAKQFDLADTKGALIAQVNKDSAADHAGIKVGDVVIRFNGKTVEDTRQLRNLVAATAPGSKVELVVRRDGKDRTVKVTLGELPGEKTEASSEPVKTAADKLGLSVEPLTADKADQLGYKDEQGVLVSEVEDGSPAAQAGLQPGDLITEINREKVAKPSEFRDAITKAKDRVLLLIKRKDMSRFVIITTK